MRTVRFTLNVKVDANVNYSVSTDLLVESDEHAHEAGADAQRFVTSFLNGYAESATEEAK